MCLETTEGLRPSRKKSAKVVGRGEGEGALATPTPTTHPHPQTTPPFEFRIDLS